LARGEQEKIELLFPAFTSRSLTDPRISTMMLPTWKYIILEVFAADQSGNLMRRLQALMKKEFTHMRSIIIKGAGIQLMIPQILAPDQTGICSVGIAAMRFRKTLHE
jgi:hypothetical protein